MPSSDPNSSDAPSVSVVIPVRNEAGAIAGAVASALAQDTTGRMEVIVADGASTDGTVAAIEAAFGGDERVVVVDSPTGTTPAGLNAAIRASGGDVIVRCDAHAVLPPGYIARATSLIETTGADVVGGLQVPLGTTPFSNAVAGAMADPLGTGGARYRGGSRPGPTDTVYLGVFRRETLERVGLFDESLLRNQDYELNYRIRAAGGTVYFHPDLRVSYTPRLTAAALWSQYWQYGSWKREMLKRNPDAMRLRQAAAPTLVVSLALSVVAALFGHRRVALFVPAVYVAALGSAAVRQASRLGSAVAGPTFVALATMHLAWGLGFFFGRAAPGAPRVPRLEPR